MVDCLAARATQDSQSAVEAREVGHCSDWIGLDQRRLIEMRRTSILIWFLLTQTLHAELSMQLGFYRDFMCEKSAHKYPLVRAVKVGQQSECQKTCPL